mgnify:CR=1 FL=1
MVETWVQMPFDPVPEEKRVKAWDMAICRGSCNSIKKIQNVPYQLCSTCSKKYRYYGRIKCKCLSSTNRSHAQLLNVPFHERSQGVHSNLFSGVKLNAIIPSETVLQLGISHLRP